MSEAATMADWPAVRDVGRQLDLSLPYVNHLIHRQQLSGVRTRLGWLVDPESVRAYEAQRQGTKARNKRARAAS